MRPLCKEVDGFLGNSDLEGLQNEWPNAADWSQTIDDDKSEGRGVSSTSSLVAFVRSSKLTSKLKPNL